MCGRYTSTTHRDKLAKLFEALVTDRERAQFYDITPQPDQYVVLHDGDGRKIALLRRRYVPAWAKHTRGHGAVLLMLPSVTALPPSPPTAGRFHSLHQ
jgi:putative SOS response-associated peptidase YedK